ncbi:MAG: GNAT family N-acetyltransferase [Propionibacteriaceae bacterium]|nr:GNAT family N-acetyltransferase [Propionibacteriaceae bacterium]
MFYRRIDEHLSLKLASPLDAEAMCAVVERNRDEFALWFGWAGPDFSLDAEREYLAQAVRNWAQFTELSTLIVLDGEVIGAVGLTHIDRVVRTCEIGYWLDAARRGTGIVTRAVREIETLAFEDLGLNRASIHADVRNQASRAVAERLGYQWEGIMRGGLAGADHVPQDAAVYSLLRDEWLARDGGGTVVETTG